MIVTRNIRLPLLVSVLAALCCSTTFATIPYGALAPGIPGFGPGVAPVGIVPGKEYSHDVDLSSAGLGGIPDPEQIVAWDGSGGTADGLDFSGTRFAFDIESQIDATANHGDHLFSQLLTDDAHLIFSVDDSYTGFVGGAVVMGTAPSAGPITLANGNVIGGAGELSLEWAVFGGANPANTQMSWAKQPELNGDPLPKDIDGVELWGPEPGFVADVDKYSLDVDMLSFNTALAGDAVSVWNGTGSPYIALSTIYGAVSKLLDIPIDNVNLDALMVRDTSGSPEEFERDPLGGGNHDTIVFSIRQIPNTAGGYLATGSELFVLDAAGNVSFLRHGGHLWDKAFALANFNVAQNPDDLEVLDINAIEAISESVVPEPTSMLLLASCLLGLVGYRWRRKGH
ncbi:MAG: PEP-CTERM sorting domain-containing protein [Pirellulales bacterium]|nr:PEP-CTERM sorting domain-containing protein [Pirellulales bacterium]